MKAGVIGLGAMGAPIAANLLRAGHLHLAWNRSAGRAEAFARETGAQIAADAARLAEDCDLVILSVSRDADVLEMVDTIAPALHAGAIVVDTSTVSAMTARTAAARLARRDVAFLDAPVSGGVEGARQGTLAMMVGGDPAVLDRIEPVLAAITGKIVWMGSTGSGQATKAVNQIVVAGIAQAVTDALAFGRLMDLDLDKVIDVVGSGAAANWFLQYRGPTMIKGRFDPGFKLNLHRKDLQICQDMVRSAAEHCSLPLVETTLKDYEELIAGGYGDEDISALFRRKLEALGITMETADG